MQMQGACPAFKGLRNRNAPVRPVRFARRYLAAGACAMVCAGWASAA